jgi:hypothetical protein
MLDRSFEVSTNGQCVTEYDVFLDKSAIFAFAPSNIYGRLAFKLRPWAWVLDARVSDLKRDFL